MSEKRPPVIDYQSPNAARAEPERVATFCVLAALSVLPVCAMLLERAHGPATNDRVRDLLGLLQAGIYFVGPFWIAVGLMHVRPFDRPTGLSVRRMSVGIRVFLLTACAIYLASLSPFAAEIHPYLRLPLWLSAGVFIWLLRQLPKRRRTTTNAWLSLVVAAVVLNGFSSHRCEHVTIVAFYGVPVFQDGRRCGNSRRFMPVWLEPTRFR